MSSKLRLAVAASAALALATPAAAVARHALHGRSGGHAQSTVSGTVASFENAILTIRRADGTTVSAKVTRATEIECEAAPPTPTARTADRHGDRSGGGHAGSDDTAAEKPEAPENDAAEPAGEDRNDVAAPSGSSSTIPTPSMTTCDRTALVPGAVVARARLAGGGVFQQIKLAV